VYFNQVIFNKKKNREFIMSVSEVFIKALQKWLELDNAIHSINKKLKHIKEEKSKIEESLLDYMSKNNLNKTNLSIGNNVIIYNSSITQGSLSLKLLNEVFDETIKDPRLKTVVLDAIARKKHQASKTSYSLKRKVNKD
jgi:hypothetical protein